MSALGGAEWCQEATLLLVKDPDRVCLDGAAWVRWVDQERAAIFGTLVAEHISLLLKVIEKRHHCGSVDAQHVAQRLLGHRLQFSHQSQDPDLTGRQSQLYGRAIGLVGLGAMFVRL